MAQVELLNASSQDASPKANGAYRTISEVSEEIDVPQHVLRFWETHFPQVKPSRMRGGRRYYRPEDIDLLKRIKALLYAQGYTIKGAKKVFKGRDETVAHSAPAQPPTLDLLQAAERLQKKSTQRADVKFLVNELRILKAMLSALL